MSKPITLEDYIYASIYHYPGLYSRNTYEESRYSVLNHLFLVIGTGVEYNPETKTFSDGSKESVSQEIIARLKAGEKIVQISKGYNTIEVCFYDDFIKSGRQELLEVKRPKDWKLQETLVKATIYPDDHYRYIDLLKEFKDGDECFHRPYPYSLEYTPMWDREAKKLIDKELILDDWREGIVEIYTWARDWMVSDKFDNNDYFNWALNFNEKDKESYFMKKWNNKESTEQLCEEYAIEPKHYENPIDMVKDIVARARRKYIHEAQLIINTYYK